MAFDGSISWFQEKGFSHVPKRPGGLKPEFNVSEDKASTYLVCSDTEGRSPGYFVSIFPLMSSGKSPSFVISVQISCNILEAALWTQQLSPTLWLLFLLLYLCEILVLVIYLSEWEFHWKVSTWFV
ncbi:hypothetical protein P5673_031585 [Acropora cervicornis]|uniref:Uncharacterized protein n=1 Tax=Acropora cervicornis TaxID=6130 RepID=A0AAD9PT87_ACRCE|nr:hypothetical protein P5673_031585 [Acropora cervicornis]